MVRRSGHSARVPATRTASVGRATAWRVVADVPGASIWPWVAATLVGCASGATTEEHPTTTGLVVGRTELRREVGKSPAPSTPDTPALPDDDTRTDPPPDLSALVVLRDDRHPDAPARDVESVLLDGFAHVDAGEFVAAAATFASAVPVLPEAGAYAAWALLEVPAVTRAAEFSAAAVLAAPESRTVQWVAGLVAVAQGRDDVAGEAFRRVLSLSPKDVRALDGLAGIAYRAERLEEARAWTERAAALAKDPVARATLESNLAELDALSGALDAAERRVRAAITLAPDEAWPRQLLAVLLDVRGRRHDSEREMARGLALDPLGVSRRATSFAWPELRLHFDGLRAEAAGDLRAAFRSFAELAARESSVGLRWKALTGRAAVHLAALGTCTGPCLAP